MDNPTHRLISPVFNPTPTNSPTFEFGGARPSAGQQGTEATATPAAGESASAMTALNPQFLAPLTPAERMGLMRQNREFGSPPWAQNFQRYGLGGPRGQSNG